MRKRYLYSLLFGLPGFIISAVFSLTTFGSLAGILWIFVLGDNPWPLLIEKILPILFAFVFLTLWSLTIVVGFIIGKRLEYNPILNKNHILVSICVTIIPALFIVLHLLNVGNIGSKSDSKVCSDFCSQRGYSGSSMPPEDTGKRSCSCIDNSGKEVFKIPIDGIDPGKWKKQISIDEFEKTQLAKIFPGQHKCTVRRMLRLASLFKHFSLRVYIAAQTESTSTPTAVIQAVKNTGYDLYNRTDETTIIPRSSIYSTHTVSWSLSIHVCWERVYLRRNLYDICLVH